MRVQSVLCRELAAMSGKQKTFTVAHGQPELLAVTYKGTANSSSENKFFA